MFVNNEPNVLLMDSLGDYRNTTIFSDKEKMAQNLIPLSKVIFMLLVLDGYSSFENGPIVILKSKDGWWINVQGHEDKTQANFPSLSEALEHYITTPTDKLGIDYYEYINSQEWKAKSKEAKQKAGYRCQLCNKNGNGSQLHTHHRTYERLGNELPEDLIVLCADCHGKFHDKLP